MLPIKQNLLDQILVGITDFRHSKDLASREYFISKHTYMYLLLHIYVTFVLLLSNIICIYFLYSFKNNSQQFPEIRYI